MPNEGGSRLSMSTNSWTFRSWLCRVPKSSGTCHFCAQLRVWGTFRRFLYGSCSRRRWKVVDFILRGGPKNQKIKIYATSWKSQNWINVTKNWPNRDRTEEWGWHDVSRKCLRNQSCQVSFVCRMSGYLTMNQKNRKISTFIQAIVRKLLCRKYGNQIFAMLFIERSKLGEIYLEWWLWSGGSWLAFPSNLWINGREEKYNIFKSSIFTQSLCLLRITKPRKRKNKKSNLLLRNSCSSFTKRHKHLQR